MKLLFQNKTVKEQFSSEYSNKWKYPERVKIDLIKTEKILTCSINMMDILNYQPFHCHKMKGNRKGEWSIRLGKTGFRVTFIPCDENEKNIKNGDIVAKAISIKIIKLTEVSNHYE